MRWIELYKNGQIRPSLEDGSNPDYLYRIIDDNEKEIIDAKGYLLPQSGGVIHASSEPDTRYGNGWLVKIKYKDGHDWRAKWGDGGNTLYAYTYEAIPVSDVEITKL